MTLSESQMAIQNKEMWEARETVRGNSLFYSLIVNTPLLIRETPLIKLQYIFPAVCQ